MKFSTQFCLLLLGLFKFSTIKLLKRDNSNTLLSNVICLRRLPAALLTQARVTQVWLMTEVPGLNPAGPGESTVSLGFLLPSLQKSPRGSFGV